MSCIKIAFLALCCLLAGSTIPAQSVLQTIQRLPDTGQTTSYTTTLGEDADYASIAPHFTDNGDGTITDTVTTLQWQAQDGGEMTVEQAASYCNSLSLGGYADWRMPDCHELNSLFDHDRSNPALEPQYFLPTAAEYWWSSQRQANDSNIVWVANAGGGIGNHPKSETISAGGNKRFHMRAVRDTHTPAAFPNHFIDNGDGTVLDRLTGLTWQQAPAGDSLTWEQALSAAEDLVLANHDDWRLPNIKELQSLNDESVIAPSINTAYFGALAVNAFWASTSLPNQPTEAWFWETQYGTTAHAVKTLHKHLLCVRDQAISTHQSDMVPLTCTIFPNPSQGQFQITTSYPITKITITNLLGQPIATLEPRAPRYTLCLTSPGTYLLQIHSQTKSTTQKIIVLPQ